MENGTWRTGRKEQERVGGRKTLIGVGSMGMIFGNVSGS